MIINNEHKLIGTHKHKVFNFMQIIIHIIPAKCTWLNIKQQKFCNNGIF